MHDDCQAASDDLAGKLIARFGIGRRVDRMRDLFDLAARHQTRAETARERAVAAAVALTRSTPLTQKDVAEIVGVDPATVSRWCTRDT